MNPESLIAGAQQQIERGDFRAALASALAATRATPNAVAAWQIAGIAALRTGDFKLALEVFAKAHMLLPGNAEILSNLAAANLRLARYADAAVAAQEALRLSPRLVSAALHLASALPPLGRLDDAVEAAERALAIDPESAESWNNIGNLYKEQGRLAKATEAYTKALELRPNLREAHSNRLAALKLDPVQTPATLLAEHCEFSRRHEWPLLARYQPATTNADPAKRLRVGYVSPDCHSAVPAFLRPVWREHDEQHFEIFAYFNNPQAEKSDARIAGKLQRRIMRGLSDAEVAAQIRADGIDILIDIAGHTGHNRLGVFMSRPAPIQITWLDYLGTTGLASMDYRLSDAIADPPDVAESGHSEALVYLPHTQWCWEPPADAPFVTPLPMLANGFITFGFFNNYPKLTDATLALWRPLFAQLPTARLVLIGVAAGRAEARVREALALAPERLRFLPRLDVAGYRAAIGAIDLALDPLPFSGATTTLDALWQGVPVMTLPSATSASRSTASILGALGLEEFVARDEAHFLAIARHASEHGDRLAAVRAGLRERLAGSVICDARNFTQELEETLRHLWRLHGEATPKAFSLAVAPSKAPRATRWRGADLALGQAREQLAARQWDEAALHLRALLSTHQNWFAAQSLLASAALAWSREHPQALSKLWAPVPQGQTSTLVSIVVCSIDDAKLAAVRASFEKAFAGVAHELIAIRDARSLAEGYNRGAETATGEVLVFSHDDIELLTPDFAARLMAHLASFDLVGVCGADRCVAGKWDAAGQPFLHGHVIHAVGDEGARLFVAGAQARVASSVQMLDGVFLAMRREVWESVRFDEERYDGFHLYDLDFSLRAHLAGFRLAVPLDLDLAHFSTGRYDALWSGYARRFEEQHRTHLQARAAVIPGSLHCRLQSLEQMRPLLAGLLHFRYGASMNAEEE